MTKITKTKLDKVRRKKKPTRKDLDQVSFMRGMD